MRSGRERGRGSRGEEAAGVECKEVRKREEPEEKSHDRSGRRRGKRIALEPQAPPPDVKNQRSND